MSLVTVTLRPGVVADDTPSASEGTWTDADKVRFVRGLPETIGGWESVTTRRVEGVCRSLHAWSDNAGNPHLALGTNSHLYAYVGGALINITPAGLPAGLVDGTGGAGFGTGSWGVGAFGISSMQAYYPRTWSLANWGQNLLACPRGGRLYEWSGNPAVPAQPVAGAPASAEGIFVTPERMVIAYGAHDGTTADPLLVRWSDQENNTLWAPSPTNMAGDLRLSTGSRIVRGLPGRGQHLLWTDDALYAMRFLGDSQLIYSVTLLGTGCGLIGPQAAVEKDGAAYWLSRGGQFYVWQGGAPTPLPCPLRRTLMDNLALVQGDKVIAGTNAAFNEIWWFYPDKRDGAGGRPGSEVSRYVVLNVADGTWSCGRLPRSAWVDAGVLPHPVAVTPDGTVYYQERLHTANGGALAWHMTTAPIDIGDGDRLAYLAGIVHDFERLEGGCTIEVITWPYPVGAPAARVLGTAVAGTAKTDTRVTARQIALRLSGDAAPAAMRLGALRLDLRATGARR